MHPAKIMFQMCEGDMSFLRPLQYGLCNPTPPKMQTTYDMFCMQTSDGIQGSIPVFWVLLKVMIGDQQGSTLVILEPLQKTD